MHAPNYLGPGLVVSFRLTSIKIILTPVRLLLVSFNSAIQGGDVFKKSEIIKNGPIVLKLQMGTV